MKNSTRKNCRARKTGWKKILEHEKFGKKKSRPKTTIKNSSKRKKKGQKGLKFFRKEISWPKAKRPLKKDAMEQSVPISKKSAFLPLRRNHYSATFLWNSI